MSLNCGKKVGAARGKRSRVEESDEMSFGRGKTARIPGGTPKCLAKHRSNGNPINCWEVGLENHKALRQAVITLSRTLPLRAWRRLLTANCLYLSVVAPVVETAGRLSRSPGRLSVSRSLNNESPCEL